MVGVTQLSPAFIEQLLQQPTIHTQGELLQDNGLLHVEGLEALLDHAMRLARDKPSQARHIATLCMQLSNGIDAPHIVPQAAYIKAQTHAFRGEFKQSLALIRMAYDAYIEIGANLDALRTNIGLMHVLNELGHHQEVIDTGQEMLRLLGDVPATQREQAEQITTFVYHNLGVCYRRIGQYEEALAAYEEAESRYQQLGALERLGDIHNNRGVTLLALGRVSEALAAFEVAVDVLAEANLTLMQAKSLNNVGEANLHLGNYTHSLNALTQAQHILQSLDALAEERIIRLHQADVYLALNLYPEALTAYAEADSAFADTGMTHYRARALWGKGAVLAATAQFDEADSALQQAASLFETAGNLPLVCSVMLEQSALWAAQGQTEPAQRMAEQAYALAHEGAWPIQQLYACLRLADLVLPDAETAVFHLHTAQTLSTQLALPHLRYRLSRRLGHVYRLQGALADAQHCLEHAIADIEHLRGNLAQEALRTSFLYDKMAAYDELLQLHLHNEQVADAFTIAEQAKSRSLVDLLTGVINTQQHTFADPLLAEQLTTLQSDLNAIYNEFLGGAAPEGEQQTRLQRAQLLEQEVQQLRLQAAAAATVDNHLTTALPFEAIQAALPPQLTLVAYHMVEDEIIAFIITPTTHTVVHHVGSSARVQMLLQKLTIQWDRFRAGQQFAQQHGHLLTRSAQRVLNQLYVALVEPLQKHLPTPSAEMPSEIVVVPHGVLHQVPFHALFDGQHYLLEGYELSYAPSATVFALCQQQPAEVIEDALVMGVPDELIPAVPQEVRAVASLLPQAAMYVGDDAQTAVFRREATPHKLLHLACHGLFRADNPMYSSLKLADGWITAVDVLSLDLTGCLVTLSACESGRNEVMAGDEVIGLTRAFLGAGAITLVVSLWLVQDNTTTSLMRDWYKRLQSDKNLSRVAALRQAQLKLKEEYPHPFYWAPFILVGQR